MGLVYRAYHAQLERTGAIKILQAITPDPDTTARFRHEAQAIAQMRHPNILNVYDFGEFNGTPYMIVEYVPGGSLANRLSAGMVDQSSAMRYLHGIAAGLDYAHKHGVVHRDVKPANVLLEPDDTPVIADFGLAKLLQGSSLKSMTGVTTGTPAYMAPEQVTGSRVGPAADRYSLATIAYEMLTGAIPFDGEALMELLYAQVHRDPPLPSSRNAALGSQVDAVIMRGLSKDPDARWESCTAFVDALGAALAGVAPPAAVRSVERTVVMAPVGAEASAGAAVITAPRSAPSVPATVAVGYQAPTTPIPTKKSRRRLWIIVSAALVVLLLLVLGVCAVVNLKPTLSLSPATVVAGESVVVTATHVPANQLGEIHLQSQLHTFPFRAGANGNVATDITVPRDVGIGNHLVSICWSGSCRASATLHVVSAVGLTSPSPRTTPGPGGSPTSTAAATPGATPTSLPTSTPRSSPTSPPTNPPTPIPTPKPTPPSPPPPSPTPTLPPKFIDVPAISALNGFNVTFRYFGGGTWTVAVVQSGTGHPTSPATTTVPNGSTYYTVHFNTPLLILVGQSDHVQVCNAGICYNSANVTVGV